MKTRNTGGLVSTVDRKIDFLMGALEKAFKRPYSKMAVPGGLGGTSFAGSLSGKEPSVLPDRPSSNFRGRAEEERKSVLVDLEEDRNSPEALEVVSSARQQNKENDEERKLLDNISKVSSRSSSKKYKKEQHYIKKLLLSRLSSPSRSRLSKQTYSSKGSILSKSSKKIIGKEKEGKKSKKNSSGKKGKSTRISFSKPLNLLAPSVLSFKTQLSDTSSITNFSKMSFNPGKLFEKKDVNSGLSEEVAQVKVKLEEPSGGVSPEMTKLRKRVCRKVHQIFCKEFKLQKSASKRLTLAIEGRVNQLYPNEASGKYIDVIKKIFRKMRVSCSCCCCSSWCRMDCC